MNVLLYYKLGIRILVDGKGYLSSADPLLEGQWPESDYLKFYLTYISLIAGVKSLTPTYAVELLIGLQILLSATGAWFIYKATSKYTSTPTAGFLAPIVFILWWDHSQWTYVVMTECIFRTLCCWTLYCLVDFQFTKRSVVTLLLVLTITLFTRPTGIILIMASAIFLVTKYRGNLIALTRIWSITLITLIFIVLLLGINQMLYYWDFTQSFQTGNIITYMDTIEGSDLYDSSLRLKPPELERCIDCSSPLYRNLHFLYHNSAYISDLGLRKVLLLLSGYRPYFSLAHNVFTLTWMFLIYGLFVLGLFQRGHHSLKAFALACILINCGLVVISGLDWDNRFYLPMEAGIIAIAALGSGGLWERVQKHKAWGMTFLG